MKKKSLSNQEQPLKSNPKIREWILPLIALAAILLFHPYLSSLQQPINDLVHKKLQKRAFNYPTKIVYFDEQSISQLGGWPISRNFYGYLIDILNQLEVSVIGVDIFFPKSSAALNEDDLLLVEMNRKYTNVINTFYFTNSTTDILPDSIPVENLELHGDQIDTFPGCRLFLPFEKLLETNPKAGFSNLNVDDRGIIRSSRVLLKFGQKLYPSFALRVAYEYLKNTRSIQKPLSALALCESEIKNEYHINFTTNSGNLECYPAIEIMQAFQMYQSGKKPQLSLKQFRNSIVLLTIFSENYGSYRAVPVSANFPVAGIHAQLVDNILSNNFLQPYSWKLELLILLALLLIFSRVRHLKFSWVLLISGASGLCYLLAYLILFSQNIILPLLSIYAYLFYLVLLTIFAYYRTQREQLTIEKKHKALLEAELNDKIASLTKLEKQLSHSQESEIKKSREKTGVLRSEIKRLQAQVKDTFAAKSEKVNRAALQQLFPGIIFSESSPMAGVLLDLKKIACSDSSVLLSGESGTGKELVARAIHRLSKRSAARFVAVNCAALTENLIESELFGHERGAFTGATQTKKGLFEVSNRGTIFLDEITETSLAFQAKLLRVVQEKEFYRVGGNRLIRTDVRIIAATNQELKKAVLSADFREDLFYRLSVVSIEIPPLRERKNDIPLLIQSLLENESIQFSETAMKMMCNYHWPGNVRELQNLVKRAIIMSDTPVISADWLKNHLDQREKQLAQPDELADAILLKLRKKGFEFSTISGIADELGQLHRSTVTEHLKGIIFKSYYENHFSIEETIRELNPDANLLYDQRLSKRIQSYLRNLQKNLEPAQSIDHNLAKLKSRFKNLPQKYHFYLEEIVRGFLNREWR